MLVGRAEGLWKVMTSAICWDSYKERYWGVKRSLTFWGGEGEGRGERGGGKGCERGERRERRWRERNLVVIKIKIIGSHHFVIFHKHWEFLFVGRNA